MKQLPILAVFLVLVSPTACVQGGTQSLDATPSRVASNGMHEPLSLTPTPGLIVSATPQAPLRPTKTPSTPSLSMETEIPATGSTVAGIIKPPDGCSLPCWMGVVPGVSSVADLRVALLALAQDPAALDEDMASYETPILLQGATGQTKAWVSWNVEVVDGETIRDLWLELPNLQSSGAVEVRELDRFLGAPDYIGFSRGNVSQYVWFDFPEESALIVFGSDYYRDVCLPKEPADYVRVVLYDPNARTKALAATDFDTIDWARQLGLSTDELWMRLQDPAQCIPVKY